MSRVRESSPLGLGAQPVTDTTARCPAGAPGYRGRTVKEAEEKGFGVHDLEKLSEDEVILELKATEELIYRIACFGTRDLIYLEMLYREIERRGLEDAVTWCRECGSDCEGHE